jgi:hypothetical protein
MRRLDQFDRDAEREGHAIKEHHRLVIKAPRLNKTYRVDGQVFYTGKYHRSVIQTAC